MQIPLLAERIPFEVCNTGEIVLNSVACHYSDDTCAIFSWDAHSKYYDADLSSIHCAEESIQIEVLLFPKEGTLKTRTQNLDLDDIEALDHTTQTRIVFTIPTNDFADYEVFLGTTSCRYGGTICFVIPDKAIPKPDLSKFIWTEGDD